MPVLQGRQHLRQTRELLRVEGMTLAPASVLRSDLGPRRGAEHNGQAAALRLQEAEVGEAPSLVYVA